MSPIGRVFIVALLGFTLLASVPGALVSGESSEFSTPPPHHSPSHSTIARSSVETALSSRSWPLDHRQGYLRVTPTKSVSLPSSSSSPILASPIEVENNPSSGVFDNENGYVYISNWNSSSVSVIDGTTVVATVQVGAVPNVAAFDSRNGWIYVPNWGSNNVSVINGTSTVASIDVGSEPATATYDTKTGFVYITNFNSSNVSVISGRNIVGSVSINHNPLFAAYDNDNGFIYVLCIGNGTGTGTLSAINGTTVVSTLLTGNPVDLGFDSFNGNVYVTNIGNGASGGQVMIVHGLRTIGLDYVGLSLHLTANEIACDPRTGLVYITSFNTNNVSVINGTTLVGTIAVGKSPTSASYDDSNGFVYVTNSGSSNVSVVDEEGVLKSIQVGSEPWSGTFDSINGYEYISNLNSSDVSAIFPEFPITFGETGLPIHQEWSVNVSNDSSTYTSAPSLGIIEPAGAYSFSVSTLDRTYFCPSGVVVVSNRPVFQNVAFAVFTYQLRIGAVGLPTGTNWSVSIMGAVLSASVPAITFDEPNGTYEYSILRVSGWFPQTPNGSVEVRGADATQLTYWGRSSYSVTFSEEGLPLSTAWGVVWNGTQASGSSSNIVLPGVPNGTYSFVIVEISGYVALPAKGFLTLDGSGIEETVAFSHSPPVSGGTPQPKTLVRITTENWLAVSVLILAAVTAVALYVRIRRNVRPKV